ncbi:hypothetical protein RchiOBHm_Chr1g0320291 [Rosa chinensis]|uniref:Uncharacterized protein n=1 Tax=Rosa chinensis TaxID=74649 RepID=A0A2P6S8S4_ROSCH|nr:hypothetical protein RchiOBHm_Chr1g0320291 [Rosa chinensis]
MILIPYGIAGGLHHLRTSKEKVQIVESLTLFLLAFFLSSAALPLLLPGLLMLLCSIFSSPFFSLCSAFYIAPIMSLVCIKHRVLEFNLK